MNSQIMLGLFVSLALVIVFLVIVVSVKTHRKIAYQKALLKTKQGGLDAKKDARKQRDEASSAKSAAKEEAKAGADRDFKPSI